MRDSLRLLIVALGAGSLYVGCGGDTAGVDDGGGDAGRMDAGPVDAARVDAPPGTDAGPPDLGVDSGPPIPCDVPVLPTMHLVDFATGFTQAVDVQTVPGDDDSFYVVERAGRIRLYTVSTGMTTTFLDIRSTLGSGGAQEQGLLGLAFHPNYAANGRFFVAYTPLTGTSGHNVVAEYHRSASDPHTADPTEVTQLFSTTDPEWNHDGGWITFGPDGFLYTTVGDGGGGCDNHGGNGNGQKLTTLLGKMMRLDPDNASGGYAAAGNPFSGATGLPQIWAYGLRNAWRNSFDRLTGDLYIGDVGQDAWEEVDFQPATSTGGENYGWRAYEGTHLASTASGCGAVTPLPTGTVMPITEYGHHAHTGAIANGIVIIGGYVYRGMAIPGLQGVYLYADGSSGEVAALRYCGGSTHGPIAVPSLSGAVVAPSSFGQDNHGELYIVGLGDGTVHKIVPGP